MDCLLSLHEEGKHSFIDSCNSIDNILSATLEKYRRTRNPTVGSKDRIGAGNGAVIRLSPVAIRYWNDPSRLREIRGAKAKRYIPMPEAAEACVAHALVPAETMGDVPNIK